MLKGRRLVVARLVSVVTACLGLAALGVTASVAVADSAAGAPVEVADQTVDSAALLGVPVPMLLWLGIGALVLVVGLVFASRPAARARRVTKGLPAITLDTRLPIAPGANGVNA
jgi:hypothetical protein